MTYRVRMWCRDCTGQDSQGCFGGAAEILSSDEPPYEEIVYGSLRDAVEAGHGLAFDAPLTFDVIDSAGEEVEYRTMTDAQIDAYDARRSEVPS